jgi:hypothetical protein
MKPLLIATLLVSCACASAQTYRCPTRYPSDGTPAGALSNAAIYLGEKHGNSALHGDVEEVRGGTDTHYSFPEDAPKWLVCQYGGKRIAGSAISGARVVDGRDWWIPLDPSIEACDLRIREAALDRGVSLWSAIAMCKCKELPPPVMLE